MLGPVIVNISYQTFYYMPLEVMFLYIDCLLHSHLLSACVNVCLDCACKIDVTADPPSSDFHDLAEIRGKI